MNAEGLASLAQAQAEQETKTQETDTTTEQDNRKDNKWNKR